MTALSQSLMAAEAQEAGSRVAEQADILRSPLRDLAARIASFDPRAIVTCARGSSDHAALFGKYVFEMATGLPVASLGPSIVSIYDTPLRFERTLFLAISQSGQSPDLIRCASAARKGGALVIALVNDTESPLAAEADVCIDICAGPELAVAATKSFLCTASALLRMLAEIQGDDALRGVLSGLPDQLDAANRSVWSEALPAFTSATDCLIITRGPGLGVASEMALKLKETAGLHASAFSAAEVHHGPKAAVGLGLPVLVLGTRDAAHESVEHAALDLARGGAHLFNSLLTGDAGTQLPTVETGHPLTQPLVQLASFYRFADRLARARGRDGDAPATLNKVTRTL